MKREVFIPAMLPGLLALWLQYQAALAGAEITSGEFAIVVGLVIVGLGVACILDAERSGIGLPAGSFGWDGVGTRRFWACPHGDLALAMYVPDMKLQAELEPVCAQLVATGRAAR